MAVTDELQMVANEARRYAGFYPEASDGRNTFIIFAEWVERRQTALSLPESNTGECETCNGRGEIGGYQRFGDGEVDCVIEPCPVCATPAKNSAEPVAEVVWYDPKADMLMYERPHKIIDGTVDFIANAPIGTKLYATPANSRAKNSGEPVGMTQPVQLTYTNYRGETSLRTITPKRIHFGATDWHPEAQWLLEAFDHDKQASRDFALKDFGAATPANSPAKNSGEVVERDLPSEFEAWWANSPFNKKSAETYSDRKRLAWEAFYAASIRRAS